jgi:hypothetical protein
MNTREDGQPVEGETKANGHVEEANHTTSTTPQESVETSAPATEPVVLTEEEATRKFAEAKALFNVDKYAEAVDLFADVLNHKYVTTNEVIANAHLPFPPTTSK